MVWQSPVKQRITHFQNLFQGFVTRIGSTKCLNIEMVPGTNLKVFSTFSGKIFSTALGFDEETFILWAKSKYCDILEFQDKLLTLKGDVIRPRDGHIFILQRISIPEFETEYFCAVCLPIVTAQSIFGENFKLTENWKVHLISEHSGKAIDQMFIRNAETKEFSILDAKYARALYCKPMTMEAV